MPEASDRRPGPPAPVEEGLGRFVDRLISPQLLARGEPDATRARMLVAQSAILAALGTLSAFLQIRNGFSAFAVVGLSIIAATTATIYLVRRSATHTWIARGMVAMLFTAFTLVNFLTAGQVVSAMISVLAVPLIATLTLGARAGAFWGVATFLELCAGIALLELGVDPWLTPDPVAAADAATRAALVVAVLISASGVLHAYFNELAVQRATQSEARLERHRAESHERLDGSPDGLFALDAAERIDFANETFRHLIGHPDHAPIEGTPVRQWLDAESLEALRCATTNADQPATLEGMLARADGEHRPVEVATPRRYAHGDPRQVLRVRDLRRFRAADQEARMLRFILDQAPIGIAVLRMDSEVLYANDTYLDLTVLERDEVIGRRLVDLSRTQEGHNFLLSIMRTLEQGGTVSIPRMDWTPLGATPAYVEVRAFTTRPPGEDERRWVSFVRDVSEIVELERNLSRAERIDSLGKLAGGIAHDFNNLLTVIMGQIDILAEDLATDHWGQEHLATILDACERSAALTNKIVDFSRKQALEPIDFDAGEATRRLLPLLTQLVPERIALDVAIEEPNDPDGTQINCDPVRFEQIIMNLVANARDAISDQGTIRLRVRRLDETPRTSDRTSAPRSAERLAGADRSEVEIEVTDDGAGMTEETKDRIFEPFFTTKPLGQGTGLGLSTVHGIVHQSGGRLEVTSRLGRGSTFRVLLPAAGSRLAALEDLPAPPPPSAPGERGRVLVFEEDPAVRDLIARMLTRFGFESVAPADVEEAADLVDDRKQRFVGLVSDLALADDRGPRLARRFRARFAEEPIVLITPAADEEENALPADLPSETHRVPRPLSAERLGAALMGEPPTPTPVPVEPGQRA